MNIVIFNVIAYISMFLDHIGYIFNDFSFFRVIGRISMPCFVFLLAYGSKLTKDIDKYILRVFFMWVISQIPFTLLFNTRSLNILFSFVLCLLLTRWKSPYNILLWLLFGFCEYHYFVPVLFFAFRRLSKYFYKIKLPKKRFKYAKLKYFIYPAHIIILLFISRVIL